MLSEATARALSKHTEFYERAAEFAGRPRERMVALGEADELFFRLYPHHYRALQLVRVSSQLTKMLVPRRDVLGRCESRAVGLLTDVIHDAINVKDLVVDAPQKFEQLAFSIWSLVFGTRALMNTAVATRQLGIEDGYSTMCDMTNLLFDALDWQPLSENWNYAETQRRIRTEIFENEWRHPTAA